MSETTFTPGPWGIEYARREKGSFYEIAPQVGAFLDWGRQVAATVDDNEANAHLIAAAPELFAALEGIATLIDFGSGDEMCWCPDAYWSFPQAQDGTHSEACRAVKAALRKARGEAS